jgi:putative ABC transport system permease protein
MIRHFFINILRNIRHNKVFTVINLVNLVIGFAVFILFSELINHELSYDKFNKNYNNIYRVQTKQEDSYPTNYCTYSPPAFRYHLMADVPEVEKVLLMREVSGGARSGQFFTLPDGSQLYEKDGYWSENSIFDIFTMTVKEGNKANALTEPNSIAISATLSEKLFPQGNAIGKQVTIGKRFPLTVTAVYADFPQNSNLKATYLVSMPTYDVLGDNPKYRDNWTNISFDNYVLLKKGADPKLVNAKIKDAFKNVKDYEKSAPYLHPLSKLHISPNSQPDVIIGLGILSFAALLILILSSVNYVNLSLANSTQRSTEIGVKKVIGASKKLIATQFLAETIMHTLFATVLALFVAQASFPLLNRILNKNIDFSLWGNGQLLIFISLVSVLVGVLSGLYPSLVISAYNPVKVLKGRIFNNNNSSSISIKKILVAAQFSISLFMLIVSFILFNHVNFILNKDLGFENKSILYSEINVGDKIPFETVKTRMMQHPEIADISYSSTIPFIGNIGGYVTWEGAAQDEKEMISRNYVNYDFIPTYNLKMAYGRNFSKEYPADNQACIINETALKVFGWNDPIGKRVVMYGKSYPVIGVVKDFHPFSVHNPIPTYIMFLNNNVISGSAMLTVRFTGDEQKARALVASELQNIFPNDPFEFKDFSVAFYLDSAISFWQSMKRMFMFFAVVTLLISTIGLFGLILFTVKRRTKEIGVRKVLGSSVGSIYWQLSTEVVGMLGFAILIGCPAAIYIYKTMPGAYKEPLSVTAFFVSVALVALIALLTISYHVLKIAISNPVEALRYE